MLGDRLVPLRLYDFRLPFLCGRLCSLVKLCEHFLNLLLDPLTRRLWSDLLPFRGSLDEVLLLRPGDRADLLAPPRDADPPFFAGIDAAGSNARIFATCSMNALAPLSTWHISQHSKSGSFLKVQTAHIHFRTILLPTRIASRGVSHISQKLKEEAFKYVHAAHAQFIVSALLPRVERLRAWRSRSPSHKSCCHRSSIPGDRGRGELGAATGKACMREPCVEDAPCSHSATMFVF